MNDELINEILKNVEYETSIPPRDGKCKYCGADALYFTRFKGMPRCDCPNCGNYSTRTPEERLAEYDARHRNIHSEMSWWEKLQAWFK